MGRHLKPNTVWRKSDYLSRKSFPCFMLCKYHNFLLSAFRYGRNPQYFQRHLRDTSIRFIPAQIICAQRYHYQVYIVNRWGNLHPNFVLQGVFNHMYPTQTSRFYLNLVPRCKGLSIIGSVSKNPINNSQK